MKGKVIRTKLLGVNTNGMALFPFILVNKRKNFSKAKYKQLINHESIHIQQQKELLVVLFYIWYVVEFWVKLFKFGSIDKAYRNISFEREAYANEKYLAYLQKRKHFTFLNYI